MKKKIIKFISAVALSTIISNYAFATKPCHPNKCFSHHPYQFDRKKCEDASDWIAIGRIKSIVHNYKGRPLNKDFASFTFIVETWEKGEDPIQEELHFTVGWCHNSQQLPKDTSGLFRFYGIIYKSEHDKTKEHRYLYFEPLEK